MTLGLARISPGVPQAMWTPWSRTWMTSQTFMTTFMSCSINRIVSWNSSLSLRMKRISSSDSWGFMPAAGSSSSRKRGSVARARAISSRLWAP